MAATLWVRAWQRHTPEEPWHRLDLADGPRQGPVVTAWIDCFQLLLGSDRAVRRLVTSLVLNYGYAFSTCDVDSGVYAIHGSILLTRPRLVRDISAAAAQARVPLHIT